MIGAGNRNMGRVSKSRIMVLTILIGVLFSVYLWHLFVLQVIDGNLYSRRAETTHQRLELLSAQRGRIFDRNYDIPLATNRQSFALTVIPPEIPTDRRSEIIGHLAKIIGISPPTLEERISSEAENSYHSIEVAAEISLEQLSYLSERNDEFPGFYWRDKPIREYSPKYIMAHILGYVGDISPEELQILFNQGYTINSVVGKDGIELQYDNLLRGRDGQRVRTVDARDRSVKEDRLIPPEPGNDLVLTIDRHIQQLASDALGERIGSVVVLRPASGEILAAVSYPTYDANLFYSRNGAEEYRTVSLDPYAPFVNRAIHSSYAPASTFKVLMTTAIFEEKVFGINDTIYARGTYRVGNRLFHDWRLDGFGLLNIFSGLANSSNVFFWTMGLEYLGLDHIIDYSYRFGFGSLTGIDLPNENAGLVPTRQWKQESYGEQWTGGDTANMSVGQGFLSVTPLQLANMVAMIVNDGVIYKPHLLLQVRNQMTGTLIEHTTPEVLHTATMDPTTFQMVKRAMRGVVSDGTAASVITTPAVEVAGKTGTGQVGIDGSYHSWFVAFAPYQSGSQSEQVIVVVFVDAVNEWEWWAPKAANIIIHGIFTGLDFKQSIASLRKAPRSLWYL